MEKKQVQRVFDALGHNKIMVLATAVDNIVSARTVSTICIDKKIYFQTDLKMQKAKEIERNPHIALCWQGIEIKGVAKNIGSTTLLENRFFVEQFKHYYPNAFKKYTYLENECVFCVSPILIKWWNYIGDKVILEYFNCETDSYRFEEYADV